jgi:ABC-type uncharacterized transport system substrate-binding protein
MPQMASDLVSRRVDVIVTGARDKVACAAKAATTTIPIVSGSDPVASGIEVREVDGLACRRVKALARTAQY